MNLSVTLSELGAAQEAGELTLMLNSIPIVNGLTVAQHAMLWQTGFPPNLLEIISNEAWYHQLAAEIGGLELSVLNKSSMAVLVIISPNNL